jgi:type II secretory pathway component PulM
LSKDGWEIDACPVNGPAVSSNGKNVAVAWFTGANDQLQVQAVLSTDSGKTFGKPIRIDEGKPLGHVDVVSLPSGGALVSWVERTDQGSHVRVRAIDADGKTQNPIPVSTAPVKSSGVPRMELSGNQAVIAWTDAAVPPHVRTASLKF